jgi:sulfhydrogenase subunit gamma (sulfur reductase)
MSAATESIYLPKLARVTDVKVEVRGPRAIHTYRIELAPEDNFEHLAGQCAMMSIFGQGEVMLSIASSPLIREYKQFSIMRVGKVTAAIHALKRGDLVGIRGPYGNAFPVDDWKGKNLVVIAGGVGLAPVWPIIEIAAARRAEYGRLTVFYGARTSRDFMYRADLERLREVAQVHLSVDAPEEGWGDFTGFVPAHLATKKLSPENTIAVTCGPPVMIKRVVAELQAQGFGEQAIYTTLENKMKCGVGKCGRCNVGRDYVCVSGPVYSWATLSRLPQEF